MTNPIQDAFPAWTPEPYIHWSAHVSLYSAKTRCYMIKKGINFTETTPFGAHLGRDIYPCDIMKKTAPTLFRWARNLSE